MPKQDYSSTKETFGDDFVSNARRLREKMERKNVETEQTLDCLLTLIQIILFGPNKNENNNARR